MKVLSEISAAQNRLCYQLVESAREDGTIAYGVKVSSTLFDNAECADVSDISSDRELAERFLNMLADYLVLPSTLCEVAEEFVSSLYTV